MPGLRLGYCMTSDVSLIKELHENGQDWNVSIPAQAAGIAALDEENTYWPAKSDRVERQYLTSQLEGWEQKPLVLRPIIYFLNWRNLKIWQNFYVSMAF